MWDTHYNQNLEKTKKTIKHNFSGNGWSEAHVWNSWFYLVFFGVTSKKQNNSTLIGFLDKTMELKWWNTTKNQGFLLVFSWFENPRPSQQVIHLKLWENTTQKRLEHTISKQLSACTLKFVFNAKSANIKALRSSILKEYDISWSHKVIPFCTKGAQHSLERNLGLCSKRLTAVQS